MSTKMKLQSFKGRVGDAVNSAFGKKEIKKRAQKSKSIVGCPVDEVSRKAETRERRRQLVKKGENSRDPKVVDAAKKLEKDMDAVEDAKLSNHIYCIHGPADCNTANSAVPGFKDVSHDQTTLNRGSRTRTPT